jgi:hypothetical protein
MSINFELIILNFELRTIFEPAVQKYPKLKTKN